MESEHISFDTLNEIDDMIKEKSATLHTLQNEIDTLQRIREDISNTLYNDYIVVDSEGMISEDNKKNLPKIGKVGVGMLIGKNRNVISVLAVVKNSSASNIGIQKKDIIISINGKNIQGVSLTDVKNMMIGEEGSIVMICILRNKKYIKLNIARMPIPGTEDSIFVDIHKSDCIENNDTNESNESNDKNDKNDKNNSIKNDKNTVEKNDN